jgi:hypothetical protein
VKKKVFYILTPIPQENLNSIIVLVKSRLEIPLYYMMSNTPLLEIPYATYIPTQGIGKTTRTTRRNLLRKHHVETRPGKPTEERAMV